MSKIYKVGIVFEFEPNGEHEDLFAGMSEEQAIRSMIVMVNEDIANGNGSVSVVEITEGE